MGVLQEKYVDFMHQLDDFVRKNEDVERPSVLAVSKRKSLADIENIHRLGQVYFGESFVQELVEKSRKVLLSKSLLGIAWNKMALHRPFAKQQVRAVAQHPPSGSNSDGGQCEVGRENQQNLFN
ncbi:hypothetical protein MHBO_000111 [Bonamia ostreae]|uniref:Uncharacterized protein n=1 Tax=Bonamia ostreae TaxID=126728 RepID=A0ABV2AEF7_9EUKA